MKINEIWLELIRIDQKIDQNWSEFNAFNENQYNLMKFNENQ